MVTTMRLTTNRDTGSPEKIDEGEGVEWVSQPAIRADIPIRSLSFGKGLSIYGSLEKEPGNK